MLYDAARPEIKNNVTLAGFGGTEGNRDIRIINCFNFIEPLVKFLTPGTGEPGFSS